MGLSTGLGLPGPFRQLEEDEEDRLPWLTCLAAASTSMLTARRLSGLLKSWEESVFRLRSEVPLDCEKVPGWGRWRGGAADRLSTLPPTELVCDRWHECSDPGKLSMLVCSEDREGNT